MKAHVLAGGLSAIALVGPGVAAPAGNAVVLTAKLSGRYLHNPGGSGTARLTFTGNRVCWQFTYKGIGKRLESGIHKAPPPPAGQRKHSVLPFTAHTTRHGCVTALSAAVEAVLANPGAYYVDIHTAAYPKGAIGGRLHAA